MASNPLHHNTYTAYLSSLLPQWPEYRGLHRFLLEDHLPLASDTRALIVDCSGDELSIRRFDYARRFRDSLDRRSPNTTTRLVFVHYTQAKTLNRDFIEAIGSKFDINPLFLCNHFAAGLEDGTRADWAANGISNYVQLSSQNISLELGHLFFMHASVLFLSGTKESHDQQATGQFNRPLYCFRSRKLLTFRCSLSPRPGQQSFMLFSSSRVR